MSPTLLCPICAAPLLRDERTYTCPRGHSYDIARGGYVNLLSGKPPAVGDNREMIAARSRTLESGVYAPLRTALCEVARREAAGADLLDSGCGEGYYTEELAKGAGSLIGIDISKDALKAAARRLPKATLAVASAYHLPLADGAVSLLSVIFAPQATEEYHRVLTRDGVLLMAIPGPRHLFSMKTILYDTPYENEVAPYELEGFRFEGAHEVGFRFSLCGRGAIADLFAMTPYYYRTPKPGRERLLSLDALDVEADVRILTYRKESL